MFNILMSDATYIVFTILIIIVVSVSSYFLLRRVIKEMIKNREEKNMAIEGLITKSEMNSLIAAYMNKTDLPFTLVYIDLDKLNDFALAFGDKETKRIIKDVAQRIKKELPSKAYLSRYKKDDFLAFLPSVYGRGDVLDIGQNLLQNFREKTVIFDDDAIDLTASIAIVQYPNHGTSIDNLLQSLELTIYRIKKDGGNALKFYNQSLENDEEQKNYYYQIKKAIERKEFMLFYQPIIDINKNKIYAYEALLRWEHPELGILAPNKFITIMEQTGDIHWVGEWGFETLVKKYVELRLNNNDVPLFSINLSPKQLMNSKLASNYEKIVKKFKVNSNKFILEIGEFTIFEKQESIIENLKELNRLGFNIAIDGFGVDISKFDRIDELGINIIKIDYKFLAEDTFAVSKYMEILSQYAEKENKIITSQGIESVSNENRIKALNIGIAQGFYYSKPLHENEFLDYEIKIVDSYV